MKISNLLEAVSAADLFRKIDGLDAMIADTATTASEKATAAELKKKLQQRLETEFPNAVRPDTDQSYSRETDEFWTNVARASQAEQELRDLKNSDPEAYRKRMLEKLASMKQKLADMKKRHVPGNVDSAYEIKEYSRKVDNFIKKELPDQWAEIERKRSEARVKSQSRQYQKRTEKEKAGRKAVKAEQKGTFNSVGKQYGPALRELYNALLGVKFRAYGFPAEMGKGTSKWESGAVFLRRLVFVPAGEIRKKWNQMDSAIQSDLRSAIEGVNTQGANFQGFTKAQKDSLLAAMSAYKK